ncbi:MAG: hypothetical protein ACRD1C_09160 [Terriglobales bacterium]
MPLTAAFHAVDEIVKAPNRRIYHNNDSCQAAQGIATEDRSTGTGGYHQCKNCERLDRDGR